MFQHVEGSQVLEGLTVRVDVFEEQPDFLGVELDGRVRAALYAVVEQVVIESFPQPPGHAQSCASFAAGSNRRYVHS